MSSIPDIVAVSPFVDKRISHRSLTCLTREEKQPQSRFAASARLVVLFAACAIPKPELRRDRPRKPMFNSELRRNIRKCRAKERN